MRVVIVGAGVVGLSLARSLRRRGVEPVLLERAPAGASPIPRPFMPSYHAYDALDDAGVLAQVQANAWEIAPRGEGVPGRARLLVRAGQRDPGRGRPGAARPGGRRPGEGGRPHRGRPGARRGGGARRARRPGGGLRRRAIPAAGDGRHHGRDPPHRGRAPVVHDHRAHRPLVRPALPGRRPAGGAGGLAGGLGRVVGHRPLRPRGRPARRASTPSGPPSPTSSRRPPPRWPPSPRSSSSCTARSPRCTARSGGCPASWSSATPPTRWARSRASAPAWASATPWRWRSPSSATSGDPDGACSDYELWRRPMVRPYEEIGPAGSRIVRGGEKPPEERWPPPA